MSDPIKTLCTVLLNIAKTSSGANINDVMAQVKSALDRNTKLTNALQTDTRMLQINLGQSKGYQVLVEGNATAYIGDRYELDTDAVIKALGKLLDEIALNQNPIGTPQNLPRSGVVEFVGRDSKLIDLHEQLQNNKRIAITAIAGMGGIGKTELALQYAIEQLQQGQYPAGICWLRARDREIATDIVTFAQVHLGLSLPDQLEIEDQVRFCWQRWPEGEALVVLDDVTDYQAIEPYLPPADPRFKPLITTRLDLGSTVQKVPLEELDEDGAIALLESLVGVERVRSQLIDAQVLCRWVGYLPLALELLGRFLARKLDWSISRLLKALDEKRLAAKALVETENGMTGQLGVAAALELSWQELNEAEQELACVLGMFAIAPIPWSLVESCQPAVDPDDLEEIRDDGLMGRSLLKRVGDSRYQLHQIVQEYFRIKLGERGEYGQSIESIFCQVMVKISKNIQDILNAVEIEQVRDSIFHLEEVIKNCLDSLSNDDLIHPFIGIGKFHMNQGNYTTAEKWFQHCLQTVQTKMGLENRSAAISLSNLSVAYQKLGKYKDSELISLEALKICEIVLKNEDLDVAVVLSNLAESSRSQGHFDQAIHSCLKALKICKNLLKDKNHPYIAMILNNLALAYSNKGEYDKAQPHYYEALEINKCLFGNDHLSVAMSLNNLAELHSVQGEYSEAEQLYHKALEMHQRLLGEQHPLIATSLNNLAELYRTIGKYKEAEPLYQKALHIHRSVLGERHPSVVVSLNNLANLRVYQGKYNEASEIYLEVIETSTYLFGRRHLNTAITLSNLAYVYRMQGKYPDSEQLIREALEINEHFLGGTHPNILMNLNGLALLFRDQGKYFEAEPLLKRVLDIHRLSVGNEHDSVAMSLNNLAGVYSEQGKYHEAEPLFIEGLEIIELSLGKDHPNIATSKWNLGGLYEKQNRYSEAKHLYHQALEIAQWKLGSNHPTTQGILNALNSLPQPPK